MPREITTIKGPGGRGVDRAGRVGGAWLTIDGRRVDVHYRDLDVVEHELAEAAAGRFHWAPLMFHLAGIPSYLVVAELAVNHVLRGHVPRPDGYPEALRRGASQEWRGRAGSTLHYARHGNAPRGQHTEVAGAIATAAMQTAHAVLAARGAWVTNEKRLLERAGLRGVDGILASLGTDPATLTQGITDAEALFRAVPEN